MSAGSPPASPFLTVRGLSKRLGQTQALLGIDLEAGADELLVVLGPTGAGKTTLLRTIAGLEHPDEGSIRMGARDVTSMDPAARDVALVFQNFSLYPRWTVRQNLEFPLRAPGRNIADPEIKRRIAWSPSSSRFRACSIARRRGSRAERCSGSRSGVPSCADRASS